MADQKLLIELCHNILELARHGDYANGNTAEGMDEGDVLAWRLLEDYTQQLHNLETHIDCPGKPCEGCASEGVC